MYIYVTEYDSTIKKNEISLSMTTWMDPEQWSPTFLAPGTGFMEDNFSMNREAGDGLGMIQVYDIQAHLLLCGPVPNRHGLVPGHCLEVGDP